MATTVFSLKLTEEEFEVLDWLMKNGRHACRADALRTALVQQASMSGIQKPALLDVLTQRANHPTRRRHKPQGRIKA